MIYPNVAIGKNPNIEKFVIIGKPPQGKREGELKTTIGDNAVIRSFTIIYAGNVIGNYFQTGHHALIRENNVIGNNVSVGTTTVLEEGNNIGDNVRIHSGVFMQDVIIKNNVFIGPNVVFTNDPHPMCPKYKECVKGATVEENARIGANVTVLPGIVIGKNALIGAGSVVTRDVKPNAVVVGNPIKKSKTSAI